MIQPPRIVPSPMDGDTFTVTATVETKSGMGAPTTSGTSPTTYTNVPGNLQPMSAARTMQYGSNSADNLYDLYLPIWHQGVNIAAENNWYFQRTTGGVSGVKYIALGDGMAQGDSGRQLIPVRPVVR